MKRFGLGVVLAVVPSHIRQLRDGGQLGGRKSSTASESRKRRNQELARGDRELFREVNNTFATLAGAFAESVDAPQHFVCECPKLLCHQLIEVPLAVYAAVREGESDFLVVPGHEDDESEEVIQRNERFLIVRA